MSTEGLLVELHGVRKGFERLGAGALPGPDPDPPEAGARGRGTRATEVLRGVDLELRRGESVAIVGPSGSGKSTLLNIMGALSRPTQGSVRFEGRDLATLDDRELSQLRNERIGFVFQSHHLLPQCSALENVLVPTLVRSSRERRGEGSEARARELLQRVGLGERVEHRPSELSGGECQRVAVVRALINAPSLLLADEPTGSLDARTADGLTELLVELHAKEELSLVVVTHSPRLSERMGRVLVLQDGVLSSPAG